MTSSNIYELTLDGTPLTREFEIPSDATFEDLGEVIQTIMDWADVRVHRFIIGDTVLGGTELLMEDEEADLEYEYLLSDFDGEDIVYEYGDLWKATVRFKERNGNGDDRAHVRSISCLSPGETCRDLDEYLGVLERSGPEDRGSLEAMNSAVERMEICTLRGGKYIEIPQEDAQEIWKALTSPDRYELVYDLEERAVCAVVDSPKVKKVGWKKLMARTMDADPERYVNIREPENELLYMMAGRFKEQFSGKNLDEIPSVKDADTYDTFLKRITRLGQKIPWMAFLDANKTAIMDDWSVRNHIRYVDQRDFVSRLATKMGMDPDDQEASLMNCLNGLQSLKIMMEPIECQFCGRTIKPATRPDLPPSMIAGVPHQQCSAICSCGKENILSYLNDGYHSGYHYRDTSVPWFEYRYCTALSRELPSKIDSDAAASQYVDALQELIRCLEWDDADRMKSKLKKYYMTAPSPDSEGFRTYLRYLNLNSCERHGNRPDHRLKALVSSSVPLKGVAGAEAYARSCVWSEGYRRKALDILPEVGDPYERGMILALLAPRDIVASEPEGYGDLVVQTLGEIKDDIETREFRRRWELSVAATIVEFASEHAHRCDDWKRVLPILSGLETVLQRSEPDSDDGGLREEGASDDGDEPIGRKKLKEVMDEAIDNIRSEWKPPARCNGLPTVVAYRLACYYLTDGKNENKGYRYMKAMTENALERSDIGPITSSRLILSEALAYRSDKDENRLNIAVNLLGGLDRIGLPDVNRYVAFIYCAVSKWTGDRVLIKFLDAGLPVDRGIKNLVYNKEMLWQFHTYEVV